MRETHCARVSCGLSNARWLQLLRPIPPVLAIDLLPHSAIHPRYQRKDVMERRIRVVGTLYIALGVFGVLVSLLLFVTMASGALIPKYQDPGALKLTLTIAGLSV